MLFRSGSSYFQNRAFLRGLQGIRWNVVEQAHYVDAGIANLQDEQLRFYKTIEECLLENRPNAALLSSVLQYLPDPEKTIGEVTATRAETIVLDRTISNQSSAHRIYVQRVPASIYTASYPCRSLSERLLVKAMAPVYEKAAEFGSLEFPALKPIESEFKGYIFRRII